MAEQVNIDILIQTAQSAKNVGDLKKALQDLKDAQGKVGQSADDFKKLDDSIKLTTKVMLDNALQAASNASNMRELGSAMKELKLLQEQVDQSSPDFARLSEGINETEGRIGDLNDSFGTLTGSGLERANKSTSLFREGLSNLDFGKVSIGLKGLAGSVDVASKSFSNMKLSSVKDGFKSLGESGVGSLIKSLANLGKAIITNPIGLIATIIIGVGVALYKLKDSIKWVSGMFDAMSAVVDGVINTFKMLSDAIFGSTFQAQDAAKKQAEAYATQAEAVEDRYNREIKLAAAAGKDTLQLEKMKAYAMKQSTDAQIAQINKLIELTGTATDEQKTKLKELTKASKEFGLEAEALTIKQITEANKKKEEEDKKKAEDDKKKADEARKKAEELAKQIAADNAKLNEQIRKQKEDEYLASIVDDEERAIKKAEFDNQRAIESINKTKADDKIKAEAIIQQEEVLEDQITKIKDDFSKKRQEKSEQDRKAAEEKSKADAIRNLNELAEIDKLEYERQILEAGKNEEKIGEIKIQALHSEKALKIALAKETGENIDIINKDYANKELQLISDIAKAKEEASKKEVDQELSNAQKLLQVGVDAMNSITALSDGIFAMKKSNLEKGSEAEKNAAKKNFEINKKMQIATATIAGIQSVLAAYQNGMKNPVPLLGPATGAIYAGIAAITAAGNIAKIKATQFESGGDVGGTGAGASPKAPSAEAGGGGPARMQAANFYGLGQMRQEPGSATQKVVVVESDITRAQNNVSKIETRATQTL